MANDIKQKIVLEGEKEYNRALSEAKRNLKTLRSELKAETAELGSNANAQQKNEVRIQSLRKQIKEQEKIVKTYKAALAEVKKEYPDNTDAIAKWEVKLNDARTTLANMNNELENVGKGFKDVQNSASMATVASKSVADSLGRLSDIGGAISDSIEGVFSTLMNTASETIKAIWGQIVDLAARSNNMVDLAGFWNTDVTTIQKYAFAVQTVSGTLEDLNSLVTKINAGDNKKIAELTGVSSEEYKDDWEYAMAVMDALNKMSHEERNNAALEIFGGKQANKAYDLLNDWEKLMANLDKYDSEKGGYGLSEEELQQMSDLYDKVNGIKASWQSLRDMATVKLFGEVAMNLTGNAQNILDAMLKYMNASSDEERSAALKEMEKNLLEMFETAKNAIVKGIEMLDGIAEDLKASDNPTAQALGNILSGLVDALKWLTEDNMANVVKALEVLANFWLLGKGAKMGAAILETVKNIKLIRGFSGGGGRTGTTGTGGGILSGIYNGASNALAGAGASISSIVTQLGGMGGLVGVVVDRVLNETNAGRGLRDGGGLAGMWSGFKQDLAEKQADIEKNASTFSSDWENNVLFQKVKEVGANAILFWEQFWKGSGAMYTPETIEEADWRPSYMQGTPNNYYNPNMPDASWWTDQGRTDGGNAGNTDGMTSADAKTMTNAVNQMPAAVQRGVSNIKVVMDGTIVGQLVAGEVSRQIAAYIS